MNFQSELRKAKQVVREWVRAHFSDQKLASVAAFNEDGKMGFRDECGCLMGVTFSDRLHTGDDCDHEHYWRARRQDAVQSRRFPLLLPSCGIGKAERAYLFLGYSPTLKTCFGNDEIRQRRLASLLRAEMHRRHKLIGTEAGPLAPSELTAARDHVLTL